MKDKYYTPEIEEFRVGFEFEMNNTWGGWTKLTLTEEMLKGDVMIGLGSGNERAPYYHDTRVKYLNREDIESLGFEYYKTHPGMNQMEFEGAKYLLTYDPDFAGRGWLRIAMEGEGDVTLFTGTIKNKSELKVLLKQLNIN
jgi:hypothetical protein